MFLSEFWSSADISCNEGVRWELTGHNSDLTGNEVKFIEADEGEMMDLANAGATKRPTCCVLVQTKPNKGELSEEEQTRLKEDYDQVVSDVRELTASMF